MVTPAPVVLITGSNRGLGLEFVRQYAADGWDVTAVCRNPAKAEDLKTLADEHKNIKIDTLDVGDAASIAALVKRLDTMAVDVLINNAGVPPSGEGSSPTVDNYDDPRWLFGGLDAEQYLNVMRINAVAPIMVSQALIPFLLRGHEKKIAMISSRQGSIELNPKPGLIAYGASKAALNKAMRKMAEVLESQGISVASFHPGWVKTDMGGKGADLTPEKSVKGIRKLIAELSFKNTGQFLAYDGKTIPW